jgi:protein-S-isoprenylcysteine O-methyltransferase Ste14
VVSLLKNLLFTVLVPGTVAGWLPYFWILGGRLPRLTPGAALAGLPVAALGLAIYLWCLWDFAITGRGTPAPIDPPKVLVVRGLYRYVRNPMYLGVLAVIAGWAITFRSPSLAIYGAVVALFFHLAVLLLEEPSLRRLFGAAYDDYCAAVSRWLPRRFEPAR